MSDINKRNGKKNRRNESRRFDVSQEFHKNRQNLFSGVYECSKCGKPIKELSAALADKITGSPIHFDCVLNELQERETLNENEAITYIGQGRFAVIRYASMVTMKEFSIVRIIECEDKNIPVPWRVEIAQLCSSID